MGWPLWDWTNADWAATGVVNSFVNAVRERHKALYNGAEPPGISTVAAGDDVQAASLWRALQQWVEDHYDQFVVSHTGGTAKSPGCYNGEADIPTYGSLDDVFSAAGLSTTAWRAYTTHPDDGGTSHNRKIQAGDIIGPWLFEDLQAVLNVLVWTTPSASWDNKGEMNERSGFGQDSDYNTALVEAQQGFDASIYNGGACPTAGGSETYQWGQWYINLFRWYSYIKTEPHNAVARAVDFYASAHAYPGGVWDRQGDWPADYTPGTLYYVGSVGPSTDTTVYSAPVGDASAGNYPNRGSGVTAGYECDDPPVVVVRWNVTDGFEYVEED